MNRIKKKIKSNNGASITFALLIFLVCAVISGIVIVAATTSAGRMSKTTEMDQRYYAVTSAAELLKEYIDPEDPDNKERIRVIMTRDTDITTTYYGETVDDTKPTVLYGPDSVPGEWSIEKEALEYEEETLENDTEDDDYGLIDDPVEPDNGDNNDKNDFTPMTLLEYAAEKLALDDLSKIMPDIDSEMPITKSLSLSTSLVDLENTDLSVDISMNVDKNGTLTLDVSNADTTKGTYKLRLTFFSDIKKNSRELTKNGTPENVKSGTDPETGNSIVIYDIVDVKTETEIREYSWTFVNVETVMGSASA